MPLPNIPQPQLLPIAPGLRLRRYDGHYEMATRPRQSMKTQKGFLTWRKSLTWAM